MIYIPKVEFSSDAAVRNKIEAIPTNILIFKFFFLSHLHFQLYVSFYTDTMFATLLLPVQI